MSAQLRSQITGAILAGGEGRRVGGADKGLLNLAGRPLVAHMCDALRAQTGDILICVNRNRDQYAKFGTVIDDSVRAFRGPLAGIASALVQCKSPWLLTVPVDAPNLSHDFASRLFTRAQETKVGVAVAHDGTRRQPLHALYRVEFTNGVFEALERDAPVWRWHDEIGAIEVDFANQAQTFDNLNTHEAFRDWERKHAQRSG